MSPGWTVVRWLRGVDLNHRPLGYEPNGKGRVNVVLLDIHFVHP
jgi:hypothetical protein